MNSPDLTGQKLGRLTVVERAGHYVSPNRKQTHALWRCICDCGNTTIVRAGMLKNGQVQSCGCLHRETFTSKTHGERRTPLYNVWRAMKERCNNPHSISYKWYGGKGIKVCDEWKNSYIAFRDWAVQTAIPKDYQSTELTLILIIVPKIAVGLQEPKTQV